MAWNRLDNGAVREGQVNAHEAVRLDGDIADGRIRSNLNLDGFNQIGRRHPHGPHKRVARIYLQAAFLHALVGNRTDDRCSNIQYDPCSLLFHFVRFVWGGNIRRAGLRR